MEIRLYQQTDVETSRRNVKQAVVRMLLCALPFLALAVAAFVLRMEPLCIVSTALCGASLILLYDLWLKPAMTYRRFLREVYEGASHETLGTLVRVSQDLFYVDGINFREVIINIYEDMDEEGERRFLLDERRELPGDWLGQDVVITSHGNVILGTKRYAGKEEA